MALLLYFLNKYHLLFATLWSNSLINLPIKTSSKRVETPPVLSLFLRIFFEKKTILQNYRKCNKHEELILKVQINN